MSRPIEVTAAELEPRRLVGSERPRAEAIRGMTAGAAFKHDAARPSIRVDVGKRFEERFSVAPRTILFDLFGDLPDQLLGQLRREGYGVDPARNWRDIAIMWANVRLRHISRRRRVTKWSEELRRAEQTKETRAAIRRLCIASEQGKNLNPHLSRKHLDAWFNDGLFNDWQIHHMHLGPRGGRKTGRTNELLYVLVTANALHLLDLGDHESFGEIRLLEIIQRNFPAELPLVRLPGILPTQPKDQPSPQERRQMQQAGVMGLVQLGNQVYAPASGVVTSGAAFPAVTAIDRLYENLGRIERLFREDPERFLALVDERALARVARPRMKLLVAGQSFALLEVTSGVRIPLFDLQISMP